MLELSATMTTAMSDSSAFTTKLTKTMKDKGVTSIKPDVITADTTEKPINAGLTGKGTESLEDDNDGVEESDLASGSTKPFGHNVFTTLFVICVAFATQL